MCCKLLCDCAVCIVQAILSDIWKGKITSSGVVYIPQKKEKPTECILGIFYLVAVALVHLLTP